VYYKCVRKNYAGHCQWKYIPVFKVYNNNIESGSDFRLQHKYEIYVLLTEHLGMILVNDQLDANPFFEYVYSKCLHVSSTHVFFIRRINCINTSGICHSM
jgi:hypothetical protein